MAFADMVPSLDAFIKARPWEMIGEGSALIFGLKGLGEDAYVVVCDVNSGCTLALCRNAQALVTYAALLRAKNSEADEMEVISLQLDQDCLECCMLEPEEDGLNEWLAKFGVVADEWPENTPVLRKRVPGCLPCPVDEEDEPALKRALFAAADLANRQRKGEGLAEYQLEDGKIPCAQMDENGVYNWDVMEIAGDMRIQYPSPSLQDELAAHRLRRLPVSGAEVMCAVRRLPMPLDENADRVPTVMLLLDDRMGVAASPIIGDYDEEYGDLASEYLGYVEENGRPKRIQAADPRAFCLLSELAGQLSTPIQRADSLPEIDDAMEALLEYLAGTVREQMGEEMENLLPEEKQTDQPGQGAYLLDGHEENCADMEEYIRTIFAGKGGEEYEDNFLVRVTYPEDPAFWLYLAVKKDGTLRQLDRFIRDIWVECCGHMSTMSIGDTIYSSNCRVIPGKSMNAKVKEVLSDSVSMNYEYDMGSPTNLKIEVVWSFRMFQRREKVLPLARNFMPKYKCIRCGKRAELVSRMDMGPIDGHTFCVRCAQKEKEVEGLLPLINSPRTGICGYGMWFDEDFDD